MLLAAEPLTLRPYQEEALAALWSFWESGEGRHPLIVLPTGAGKSLTMGELCRRALEWSGTRICVLAHRGELIKQNAEAIEAQIGERVGIYNAALRRRDTDRRVTVASIQSIYQHAPLLDPFDIIIVDECHRIPPAGNTRYQRFLSEARLQNPRLSVVGVTATPFRMGAGRLDEGDEALFDRIVYSAPIGDLIRDGYLCDVVSRGGIRKIDTSGVRVRGGEYVAGDLARAADDPEVTRAAVGEIVEFGQDRRGWMIFAAGIEHAEHIAEAVREHGVSCEVVTGEMPGPERDRKVSDFKAQRTRCLVSVEVFLEGFNAPHVDLIGMMRPTKSPVRYIQAVGRGMRTHPGKTECLLLDYAGVVSHFGPIDKIDIKAPRQKDSDDPGEAPAKECPECRLLVATATRQCPGCGHEWPPPDRMAMLETRAYGGAVLSHQRTMETVEVQSMEMDRWQSRDPARRDTVRITYQCGLRRVSEWLTPEHPGQARRRFELRCRDEWGLEAAPRTIEETLALAGRVPIPAALIVRPQKDRPKYLEVMRRLYAS